MISLAQKVESIENSLKGKEKEGLNNGMKHLKQTFERFDMISVNQKKIFSLLLKH